MKLEEKQDGLEKTKHIFYTLLNARTIQGWLIKMMLSLKMCYPSLAHFVVCCREFLDHLLNAPHLSLPSVCLSLSLTVSIQ